jgi:hypothetical protein
MTMTRIPALRRVDPVRDDATLLPLLRSLWPLLELPDPAPSELPPRVPVDWKAPRPLLAREQHTPCPYNGGPREIQRLLWRDGERSLEVELRDEVWVAPSLSVFAKGPRDWLDAVDAAVHRYLSLCGAARPEETRGG